MAAGAADGEAGTDMAYVRDTDQHLRGVGAIASRDAIDPRRSAIRAARARATNARDRQLSQITYQERGGMGRYAMGAINKPLVGGGGGVWYGPRPTGMLSKVYSGAGGMGAIGPVQSPPPPPQYIEAPAPRPVATVPPPIAVMTPPIMMPPTPAPAAGPVMTPTVIGPTDIGVLVGAPPPPIPPMPTVVVPILPPDDASSLTSISSSTWLLWGAAGLAAYLLFFSEPSRT